MLARSDRSDARRLEHLNNPLRAAAKPSNPQTAESRARHAPTTPAHAARPRSASSFHLRLRSLERLIELDHSLDVRHNVRLAHHR
jgi:hypothetical protein